MDELSHKSATELAGLIGGRKLSSRELLDHYIDRIERLNPPVNAVVTLDVERARQRASALDERLMREGPVGPLHGLPMTVKDAYEVAGVRTTGGIPELTSHVPKHNALIVQRLHDAGAVIFGKTNVPAHSADLQTFNEIFGTTNNPHALDRTPGGSSGGAAVAVACGFTALELGSDIGGSIRNPSNWTGVYGHKPSYGLVPRLGHIPGPPGSRGEGDLNVCGPIARSAADLMLELDVIAGPDAARAKAWKLELPPPRRKALSEYRIAAWFDDPAYPVDDQVREVLERSAAALTKAGAQVDHRGRPDVTLAEIADNYLKLLNPIMVSGMPNAVQEALMQAGDPPPHDDDTDFVRFARTAMARHVSWLREDERRARYRVRWADFFERYDALLCPVSVVTAIAHDQAATPLNRTITVNGVTRPYMDILGWSSLATSSYLPATVAPVGRSQGGMPVGVEIIGPYLEDRTTLDLAMRMADVVGGFVAPSGF